MRAFRLDQLSDASLTEALQQSVVNERTATAALLAHLAEFDRRRLYAPAGYACMRDYCVRRLHLSEGAAFRRITAARAARKYPPVFEAIADGRVHLSAIAVLNPHLRASNVTELVDLATHRTKTQVEELIAARFPRPESLELVMEVAPAASSLCPGRVEVRNVSAPSVPDAPQSNATATAPQPSVIATAPRRFTLTVMMSGDMKERLEHYRALVSEALPGADLAQILDDALKLAIAQREKRKLAATDQPRTPRASANPRTVPAHVRRDVYARDDGRCTFVSDDDHRCESRSHLQFDHIEPVARGIRGRSMTASLRFSHCAIASFSASSRICARSAPGSASETRSR